MTLPKIPDQSIIELIKRYKAQNPYLKNYALANLIKKKENTKIGNRQLADYIKIALAEDIKPQKFTMEDEKDFELPESDYKPYVPYELPKSCDNVLILSDIHFPYQDNTALRSAIKYGIDNGVNAIILNGDILDCYQASRFVKDIANRNIAGEVEIVKSFLKTLRKLFRDAEIIFKTGNHEDRWKNLLLSQAPEFVGLKGVTLEHNLELDLLGIKFVDDKQLVKAGRLFIAHGHEIFSSAGAINVARTFRLKANDNVCFGHFHRVQDDIARTISDKIMGSFAMGCLCGLSPLYMPINQWSHGFGHIQIESDGNFVFHNKKIINGVIR
jgi:predicted phosphodiesterase